MVSFLLNNWHICYGFSKVAFDILNHLPGCYESSWGQSGGLISPDVCTPEVMLKIFLLMITMQLIYLI